MNYLDRNEFNFQPSEQVRRALQEFDISELAFYTRVYDRGIKSVFSEFVAQRYGVPERQVLMGYGAEDLLKMAVHYFLTDGDVPKAARAMWIPALSWWYYKSIADEVGGETSQYPLIEAGDTFVYDLGGLEKMLVENPAPRILLVASPNNPTGNSLTEQELDSLASLVPASTVILVDEAYASFITEDTTYIPRMLKAHPDNLIFLRTLSKFYGLPGLRLGFGFIGGGERMSAFARYANKYLGYDRLSERVGIAALQSDDHYREVARVMERARQMYRREIGPIEGFKVYKSVANFILIKYPRHLKEALREAFVQQDYKVKFMDEPGLDSHMRITLGREEQNRCVCDTILRVAKGE